MVEDYEFTDDSSQLKLMRQMMRRTFLPYVSGGIALELGCEAGYMSEILAKMVDELHIVDGSQKFIEISKKRKISNATYFYSLFEEYETDVKYDYVFASHVLEHLLEVAPVLRMAQKVVKPNGYIFIVVPNAKALSRQLARHMGFINSLYDLTPNDLKGGHRRVYDMVTLRRDVEAAGLKIVSAGGIFLKPFADFQMDKIIDNGIVGEAQADGLYRLGNEYPDMCGDIYVIAR